MIRRPPRSTLFPYRRSSDLGKALEKLLTYYPKRDYWLNLVYGIAARPGFSERLALDVARLKIETGTMRSEEHTSELQSPCNLVCRLLLEKKKNTQKCGTHSD